jgi:hypothetical protein
MTVRLGFAVAANLSPDILILDEVLAVGDMAFQTKCLNTLGRLRKNGTAFILVTHNMLNIMRYCDKVLYMSAGSKKFLGNTEEGVKMYENKMKSNSDLDDCDNDAGRDVGTGLIKIVNVKFCKSDSLENCNYIKSGCSLDIWVEFEKKCDDAIKVRPEFSIRDALGLIQRRSGSQSGGKVFNVSKDASKGYFRFKINAISMNSSFLKFGILLWNHDYSECHDWVKDITIKSESTIDYFGRVYFPYEVDML